MKYLTVLILASALSGGGTPLSLFAATNDIPAISVTRDGRKLTLQFSGVLESAVSVAGPWTPVSGATSPLVEDTSVHQKFFRVQPPAVESIFASDTVVRLQLTGPFQKHFDLAFAGTPDGFFPPKREKPYFDGTATLGAQAVSVSLRVRGNSSLQECPFPKLKMKIAGNVRTNTPFADAREIKIGTHCAEGGRGNIGRLRDQTATYREALAYEIMRDLGFTTPRLRRARIEYSDTTPPVDPGTGNEGTPLGPSSPGGGLGTPAWPVTRDAFLFDDVEVVAERLGGTALSDAEISVLTSASFDPNLITALEFLHVLLGNWDYSLAVEGRGLWNTDVVALPDGTFLPLAGDFDLSSWVTEVVRSAAPNDYLPGVEPVEREARFRLEQLRGKVSSDTFRAAKERFESRRTALESRIANARVDDSGRANALKHVRAFFDALAANIR